MPKFALAFLDCEFGGLDPEQHDITEIGVIVTDYRLAELASGEWKVQARPERITAEAAAIFGYDAERWEREGVHVRRALEELAALKPADFFGNDDVLYLMEDMATGEIRLSILWEWLHKARTTTSG